MAEEKVFTRENLPENIEGEFVIPEEFTEIGARAFIGCASLTNIVIPDSVTEIGDSAFCRCASLTSIVIPEGVTKIWKCAFQECSSLTSIVIPNSVTEIGDSAFYRCASLTSIVIPEGVTKIGKGAFSECRSLTSIVIPDSVADIASSAFRGCASLSEVKVSDSNKNYSSLDGVLYDKNRTALLSCCKTVTNVVIPDSVTKIGWHAFVNCTSLASIKIPSSVTSIGAFAFDGCTSLTSIEIPDSVTEIGKNAFDGCTSLASIEIPNSVTGIGVEAFNNCQSLVRVEIPNSVTVIDGHVFNGCTSLTSIVIPEGVTKIEWCAFRLCSSLTSIVIPDSVTEIGDSIFDGCTSLSRFEYPKKLKFKKKDVFDGANIDGIEFVVRGAKPEAKATATAKVTAASANVDIVSGNLKGQVICVSGKFKDHSQEEMEALVTSNGATVSSSVTKKTTMLVTGDKVGATKLSKAQELGIKIVPQDEFFAMLSGSVASENNGKISLHDFLSGHIVDLLDYAYSEETYEDCVAPQGDYESREEWLLDCSFTDDIDYNYMIQCYEEEEDKESLGFTVEDIENANLYDIVAEYLKD